MTFNYSTTFYLLRKADDIAVKDFLRWGWQQCRPLTLEQLIMVAINLGSSQLDNFLTWIKPGQLQLGHRQAVIS